MAGPSPMRLSDLLHVRVKKYYMIQNKVEYKNIYKLTLNINCHKTITNRGSAYVHIVRPSVFLNTNMVSAFENTNIGSVFEKIII